MDKADDAMPKTFVRAEASTAVEPEREADAQKWRLDARRAEIMSFTHRLDEMGVTLKEVARASPRHASARRTALAAGLLLTRARRTFVTTPARDGTVDPAMDGPASPAVHARKGRGPYAIAMSLIQSGDFPNLHGYLRRR